MPVVGASALVEYLAGGRHAIQVRKRLVGHADELWAPHLVDAEVGSVLRRSAALGELGHREARSALDDLEDLPLRRAGHLMLLERAWALRGNLTFHDALYVALAERLGTPLVTLDARLARALGVRATVDVID